MTDALPPKPLLLGAYLADFAGTSLLLFAGPYLPSLEAVLCCFAHKRASTGGGAVALRRRFAGGPTIDAVTLRPTRKRWVEPQPERCANGHPLVGGQVLVGTQHCDCMRTHRTHTCRLCGDTTYTPPLGSACRRHEFDER